MAYCFGNPRLEMVSFCNVLPHQFFCDGCLDLLIDFLSDSNCCSKKAYSTCCLETDTYSGKNQVLLQGNIPVTAEHTLLSPFP